MESMHCNGFVDLPGLSLALYNKILAKGIARHKAIGTILVGHWFGLLCASDLLETSLNRLSD